MDTRNPKNRDHSPQKEIEDFSELLTNEYYNFRLKNLADRIKTEQYRPKPRMLFY